MPRLVTVPSLRRATTKATFKTRGVGLTSTQQSPPIVVPVSGIRPLDQLDSRVPRNPRPLSLTSSKESTMPSIITLPSRQGSIEYSDEQIKEVADLLDEVGVGQGVAIEDEPQDTEPKARNRAKIMRDLLKRDHDMDTRTHAVEVEDGGGYLPALSLKKS